VNRRRQSSAQFVGAKSKTKIEGDMRKKATHGPISLHAIAGSHVVLLGMNMAKSSAAGLLGFAIERTDHTEDERYWLKGFKTFPLPEIDIQPGELVSTLEAPIQSFLWGDFTAKPNHDYTYRIVAMRGKPKKLKQTDKVDVRIQTEDEDTGTHAVWFNRGVAGSQAYARRYHNKHPKDVANRAAWKWLSRGLEEAMLAFIAKAKSNQYGLRAAVYEFRYAPVLNALNAARKAGADVQIVFDAKKNSQNFPRQDNLDSIAKTAITELVKPREKNPSYIAHNKFIVLLKKGRPIEVWTGSTNISEGGIFGQSNVGHLVRDPEVARKYYEYWQELSKDPEARNLRLFTRTATPVPARLSPRGTTMLFSPQSKGDALNWYAQRVADGKKAICFTLAFGVNQIFKDVLVKEQDSLRYVLLEKEGNDGDLQAGDPDCRVAVGSVLDPGPFKKWLDEQVVANLNVHAKYIHSKYLLVDPLADDPLVVTGSANFSPASTTNNDENMLLIRGDKRVADIYLGEFMRLFNHFYFRYHVNRMKSANLEKKQGGFLSEDNSWTKNYFKNGHPKQKERLYFAG
jgi:phosphatidylserine/phosphatidylglycerophosphate/cardiolipin synthase-like enzyme